MENLYIIDVRLLNKERDYLKWTSKSSYMLHKIFDNHLVATHKIKVVLMLNKPTYVGLCVLGFIKLLMYEFQKH